MLHTQIARCVNIRFFMWTLKFCDKKYVYNLLKIFSFKQLKCYKKNYFKNPTFSIFFPSMLECRTAPSVLERPMRPYWAFTTTIGPLLQSKKPPERPPKRLFSNFFFIFHFTLPQRLPIANLVILSQLWRNFTF